MAIWDEEGGMFKHATIHLEGPICECAEQKLRWNVVVDDDGKLMLEVGCLLCHETLTVAHPDFVAGFELARPYPGVPRLPRPKPQRRSPFAEGAFGANSFVAKRRRREN